MWKTIEGYEGKYLVNAQGQIWSISQKKVMSLQLGGNGYYKVGLWKNGVKHRYIVHRIVAEHFIDNPRNKPQVNHIDGNKLNNTASNLEWRTPKENSQHAFGTGLRKAHYKNVARKFGATSQYHYVERLNSTKDGVCYRAVVKATIGGRLFSKSKQFSVSKYGESEAEILAAKAANELVLAHAEFAGYALNTFGKTSNDYPVTGSRIQANPK